VKFCHKLRKCVSHNDANSDVRPLTIDFPSPPKHSLPFHLINIQLAGLHILLNSLLHSTYTSIVNISTPQLKLRHPEIQIRCIFSLPPINFSSLFLCLLRAYNLVPMLETIFSLWSVNKPCVSFQSTPCLLSRHYSSPISLSLAFTNNPGTSSPPLSYNPNPQIFWNTVSLCSPGWPFKCWYYRHVPPHLAQFHLRVLPRKAACATLSKNLLWYKHKRALEDILFITADLTRDRHLAHRIWH
jgi:hypothetical protein